MARGGKAGSGWRTRCRRDTIHVGMPLHQNAAMTLLSTRRILGLVALLVIALPAAAQSRDPVTADPVVRDRAFPPSMDELSFSSGGARLNGLIYLAQGMESHPTVVLLHGYPGNERNLDLAQSMRRAGMNVLYFNYRGAWGSGGDFSFANAQEDVAAAVRWLRTPDIAAKYRVAPHQIALVGHSMGAWLALLGAAADSSITCVGALELADMSRRSQAVRADSAKSAERLSYDQWITEPGAPLKADAKELEASLERNAQRWDLTTHASELARRTVLLLDNDKNTDHAPLVSALRAAGAKRLTADVWQTDHGFSDKRIQLGKTVVKWLQSSCGY